MKFGRDINGRGAGGSHVQLQTSPPDDNDKNKTSQAQAIGNHLYGAAILLVTAVLWASGGPTTKYLFLLPAPPSAALLTTCISVETALFLLVGLMGSLMEESSRNASRTPHPDAGAAEQDDAEAEALLHSGLHAAVAGARAGAAPAVFAAARSAAQHQDHHHPNHPAQPHRGFGLQTLYSGFTSSSNDPDRDRLNAANSRLAVALSSGIPPSSGMPPSPGGGDCDPQGVPGAASRQAVQGMESPSAHREGPQAGPWRREDPWATDPGQEAPGTGHHPGHGRLWCLTAPARTLPAAGLELGVYNVAAAALGAWGMQRISATRSAFLAQATSLVTPLLVWLSGGRVGMVVWLACCSGALGGAMVALDNVYGIGSGKDGSGGGGAGGARLLMLWEDLTQGAAAAGAWDDGSARLVPAAAAAPGLAAGNLREPRLLSAASTAAAAAAPGGGRSGMSNQQSMGAVYVLLSCVFWGLGTVRLGVHSARFRPLHLAAAAAVSYAGLAITWLLVETISSPNNALADFLELGVLFQNHLAAALLLWAGLGPGALSSYLQVVGQQTVPPAQAQVLFSSTPLWAALIAQLLLPGERMGPLAWAGGAVMLGASLLASLWS